MTTLNEARGAIYEAFVAGWGSTSLFTFDNESFDPPDDAAWARLTVRHAIRAQESLGGIGARKFESEGSAIVQCFAPLDSGASLADALAEVARSIFEGKTLLPEVIRFTSAEIQEIGPTDAWYQINCTASFSYTQTK